MGRYFNLRTTFEFPDISEDGDLIYVTIRNPKTVPLEQLTPHDVAEGPDGKSEPGAMKTAMYGVIAGLVLDWHVYDGTAEDDSEPLGLPATAEMVATLPMEITKKIMDVLGETLVAPQ